jgi:thiamine biosynthesis lipoprotein
LPRGPLLVGALIIASLLLLRQRYCARGPTVAPKDAGLVGGRVANAGRGSDAGRVGDAGQREPKTKTRATGDGYASRRIEAMGKAIVVEAPAALVARSTYLTMRAFERVELLTSRSRSGSAMSKLQRAAGQGPQQVPAELWTLLQRGRQLGALTLGRFDISDAALVSLWDFDKGVIPAPAALKGALPHVDIRRLKLAERGGVKTVELPAGMRLGVGGVAQGRALEAAAEALKAAGVGSASLSAGGQVLVYGGRQLPKSGKAASRAWRVALRDPLPQATSSFAVVSLKAGHVATRGDYERFFERSGVRYHAILDPRSGQPTRGLRSATVIDLDDALRAHALATALMVLGREQGLALIERTAKVEALVIDAEGKVHLSSGAKRWVALQRAPRLAAKSSPASATPARLTPAPASPAPR